MKTLLAFLVLSAATVANAQTFGLGGPIVRRSVVVSRTFGLSQPVQVFQPQRQTYYTFPTTVSVMEPAKTEVVESPQQVYVPMTYSQPMTYAAPVRQKRWVRVQQCTPTGCRWVRVWQ